jgi:hypothetical protein
MDVVFCPQVLLSFTTLPVGFVNTHTLTLNPHPVTGTSLQLPYTMRGFSLHPIMCGISLVWVPYTLLCGCVKQ